jgi:hypothetical protein
LEKNNSENQQPDAKKQEPNAEISEKDAGCEEMRALYEASISGQSQSERRFCEISGTTQEQLTNSSKEFVSCVSDTLTRISHEEETAHAPWGARRLRLLKACQRKRKTCLWQWTARR